MKNAWKRTLSPMRYVIDLKKFSNFSLYFWAVLSGAWGGSCKGFMAVFPWMSLEQSSKGRERRERQSEKTSTPETAPNKDA